MEFGAFIKGLLDRNEEYVLKAVEGISLDDLHRMPTPETNSIGWLLWHLSRVQDRNTAAMAGWPQAWITAGWHAKFGRAANPDERGNGDTPAQVAAFRAPSVEIMVGYYKAGRTRVDKFLATLTLADLERPVAGPNPGSTVPLNTRLTALALECCQHGGQIAYVRGMLKGTGWWGV